MKYLFHALDCGSMVNFVLVSNACTAHMTIEIVQSFNSFATWA